MEEIIKEYDPGTKKKKSDIATKPDRCKTFFKASLYSLGKRANKNQILFMLD